jgi:hypothetical protein
MRIFRFHREKEGDYNGKTLKERNFDRIGNSKI